MVQTHGAEIECKEGLIAAVKKEVKQVMEEAVTKKYVHKESSSVTQLCGAVEACLGQGLRRRALGLFKTSSTTALLHKIAKACPDAEHISKLVLEIEASDSSKRSISSTESFNRTSMLKKCNSTTATTINTNTTNVSVKYLWIRLALYEKRLVKIIEYLVSHAGSYYDRDSLVADPDYGCILSSLLVGPCALDFTRVKTADHYWTDPHADELVQRHRMSSGRRSSSTCSRPPILNFKRSLNTSSDESSSGGFKPTSTTAAAKEYVESLHQNSRATLLYGKNNVQVLPKDVGDLLTGYLSLHQHIQSLIIKWTPNQLMNGQNENVTDVDQSSYWSYALNINVDDIVYVHCHQSRSEDTGGTIILVGQDGVQRPPIHFPEGGHMQQFLSCLETGLLPHGQLDPPLWSQRGIGKMFPLPNSVRRRLLSSVLESFDETPIDYVFRIVSKSKHEEFVATHSILDFVRSTPRRAQLSSCSTTGSSDCSNKSLSIDQYSAEIPLIKASQSASIEMVCSTMRRQIISRAFYGWLAYCRHLSTVRTHLTGLVNARITPETKADEAGLTKQKWAELNVNGVLKNQMDFYQLVYFGGVHPELRKEVWPYLLGYYKFGSTAEERLKENEERKHYYEMTMSEWLAVGAIVEQREKEKTARAVAKLSSGSNSGNEKTVQTVDLETGLELENEVFEDISDMTDSGDFGSQSHEECKSLLLVKSLPRDAKESTDSAYADDANDDVTYEMEKYADIEQLKIEAQNNHSVPKAKIEEAPEVPAAGSASTSSYETVTNDYAEYPEPGSNITSPLFLSADDLPASLLGNVQPFPVDKTGIAGSAYIAPAAVIVTGTSVDLLTTEWSAAHSDSRPMSPMEDNTTSGTVLEALQQPKSACVSPASSNGGVYSCDLLEKFGLNLQRIEKDVQRCDRNYWYFANENLDKLRNVISTYVWEHLDVGYMQGMCDLVAPLLVIFDDEALSYSCFCKLMERMILNFPNGGAMDMHFANMRSLIQILDSEIYELMDTNGDYTHFYFCYRWFLLDFKRELIYEDVFTTWEIIWAAKHVASAHFVLFLALALLETYRDIILSNSMDFTDVIKFFNEMAERHNAQAVLQLARSLVLQLQMIIENK